MEHSSSTSSSRPLRLGWVAATSLLLVLPWIIDLGFGNSLTETLASRAGARIERFSKGVIPDSPVFLRNRIREVAWLSTALFALILGGGLFRRLIQRRVPALFLWAPLAVYVFVAVNLFLVVAGQTVSFWGGLFVAKPNLKQAAFHLRRTLLAESTAPTRGVVVGSSQGGSEIDDGQLNASLYPDVQFSNLSYAGSGGFDFLLLQEQYLPLRPGIVIGYLSELNLYTNTGSGRFIPLLGPQGVRDLAVLDRERAYTADVGVGLGAYLVPAFRIRRALELALYGSEAGDFRARIKTGPARTLDEAAAARAKEYSLDDNTGFQKRSLQLFLERNQSAGITTVLIVGQVSPRLEQHLAPEVVADFRTYVESLADSRPPGVVVLSDLPRHEASDYGTDDLMHIQTGVRKQFTAELIRRLAPILSARAR